MTFQRARTDEQRDQRKRTILDTTASMLTEMTVSEISLNELSRRVGLAKSNVMRYFESREAILLELLDAETAQWSEALAADIDTTTGSPTTSTRLPADQRASLLAHKIATTLQDRPVTCDLISAQSGVLERNVSADVAVRHKRRTLDLSRSVGATVTSLIPELSEQDALEFTAAMILTVSAAWPSCTPTAAITEAYETDPELAPLHMSFTNVVTRTLALCLGGLLAERGDYR